MNLNSIAIIEDTFNAQYNNITKLWIYIIRLHLDIFQYVTNYSINETVVILDPPKERLFNRIYTTIIYIYIYQPQCIVYMSCDLITQARDASIYIIIIIIKRYYFISLWNYIRSTIWFVSTKQDILYVFMIYLKK